MWYYHFIVTNKRERNAMQKITITLSSQRQVNSLHRALQMQYDMENDIVLDDTITSVREVRDLAVKSNDEILDNLKARRKETNDAVDRLVDTIDLQNQLQNAIDRQHD
jgi:hypothetical protein